MEVKTLYSKKRRFFHHYKKEYGATQREAIKLYYEVGKNIDEIQELLKCPRPSIRRCISEIKRGIY
jgi:DNA-directed RNA polymerase specialized sigma24 family protein